MPLLLALLLVPAACATPDPGTLTAAERAAAVARLADSLAAHYVFPERGAEAGAYLRARLAEGAYDGLDEAEAFAARLTADLAGVAQDGHLRVRVREPELAGEADPAAEERWWNERMRRSNYGVARVEVLEGNVGVLDLRGFASLEPARPTLAAAMGVLAHADALVVDLRRNGGGDPAAVQFLCSYLFDAPTHLNSLFWRDGDGGHTEEFWTLAEVPGRRRPDVPVFVVTSRRTFSGAEEFAYNLRTRERATLVGEVTGGGANPGRTFAISGGLEAFIPTGRAINPVTGTNWEGTGVQPHIAVPADEALDRAVALAREAAAAAE